MGLFVDTADLNEIQQAWSLGFVKGVTTNPSLIAKVNRPGLEVLRDILSITTGPVFYQVTAESLKGRLMQARKAAALAMERVLIKIPATTENMTLAVSLVKEDIRVAVTAVSAPAQAYLAAEAGAEYAIPYVNRLTRQMGDGVAVLRACKAVTAGSSTKVMAASLKSPEEVAAVVTAGAIDLTIPLDLLLKLGDEESTQGAIEQFNADYIKAFGSLQ